MSLQPYVHWSTGNQRDSKPFVISWLVLSAAVFAYGATGAGKTHTMLGSQTDPGVMYRTMTELFKRIDGAKEEKECTVAFSYLEVNGDLELQFKKKKKEKQPLLCKVLNVNSFACQLRSGLQWADQRLAGEWRPARCQRGRLERSGHPGPVTASG